MDIKEILLNGGIVSFSYKENKKDWVDTAKVWYFSGHFGIKPKIRVEVPTLEIKGSREFEPKDIDEAISLFERLVFNPKNLCYKYHEAMINLHDQGHNLDLGLEDDYKLMNIERLKLIK